MIRPEARPIAPASGLIGISRSAPVAARVLSLCLAVLASGPGCAGSGALPDRPSMPPRAIDLSPRCLESGAILRPEVPRAETLLRRRVSSSLEIAVVEGPVSPLRRLRWSTPVAAFSSPEMARAAFQLWAHGELTEGPEAFRRRALDRSIAMTSGIAGARVDLDLIFPAGALDAAIETLAALLHPVPIGEARFEGLRRETALLLLAEEGAPANAARRLRRAVEAPREANEADEEGAQATLARLDPASIQAALVAAIAAPGNVVAHATPSVAAEAALGRLAAAAANWPMVVASRSAHPDTYPDAEPAPTRPSAAPASAIPNAIHLLDQPGARQVEILASLPASVRSEAEGAPSAAAMPGSSLDDADRPALEMLASLLGDPVGGRLFRDLRERQGLAYEIGASLAFDDHFAVSTRTRPERLAALIVGIEAHWQALVQQPVLDCEAAMLTDRMIGALALEADDPKARLDALLRARDPSEDGGALAVRAAAYQAVSSERLSRVARERLAAGPTFYLVGDAHPIADRLAQALPGREIRIYDANRVLRETRRAP